MVVLVKGLDGDPQNPLRGRAQNRSDRFVAGPCSKPFADTNLRRVTYETCIRLESCARDPIGYAADSNAFNYVKSRPLRFVDPLGLSQIAPNGDMIGEEWRYGGLTGQIDVLGGRYWYEFNYSAGFFAGGNCADDGTLSPVIQADSGLANESESIVSDYSGQENFNLVKASVTADLVNKRCDTQTVEDACGCHIDGEKAVCTAEAVINVVIDTEIRDLSGYAVTHKHRFKLTVSTKKVGPLEVGVCCPVGSPAR